MNSLTRQRALRLLVCAAVLLFSLPSSVSAADVLQQDVSTRIVPEIIDEQTIYPTNHAVIALDPLWVYTWQRVELPGEWAGQGYYFELWDAKNQIVPGFAAQKLEEAIIDMESVDASLHPKVRVVIFQPETAAPLPYTEQVRFYYQEQYNYRLLVFASMISALIIALLIGAVLTRVRASDVLRGTRALLKRDVPTLTVKQMVIFGWLVVLWSGVFGFVLGSFIGGIQILYVLIKMPFLLLGAFAFTVISNIVLSLLLGVNASIRELIVRSMSSLAATAVGLAAFSPVIIFYILLPQNHDQLLVSTVFFFGLAGLIGVYQFHSWVYARKKGLASLAISLVWVCVYGVVVLQLAWMLRPWVGVIDPVHDTVPFSRPYGGNVFVELIHTTQRL